MLYGKRRLEEGEGEEEVIEEVVEVEVEVEGDDGEW